MRTSTLSSVVILWALGCGGTGSSGQGGSGGTGGSGAGGGTGGAGDGTFYCGESDEGEVRCIEGEEYCYEEYAEDGDYAGCEPLPEECTPPISMNWCECVLGGPDQENCEIEGCDPERHLGCR